jgi:hypothetical protein
VPSAWSPATLGESDRHFALSTGGPLGVTRWRFDSQESSAVPLSANSSAITLIPTSPGWL